MEKPLTAKLSDRFGGSPLSTLLDPAIVAANFGASYPVGESLPESSRPIGHLEDQLESGLLIESREMPSAKPEPKSLFAIATARLRSIPPRTKERARQVAQMLVDLQESLVAFDALVSTLESERHDALVERFEQLQSKGRALRERINSEFEAKVNTSMMQWNAAEEKKTHAEKRLQLAIDRRRTLRKDRYSTTEQLQGADQKVSIAAQHLNAAKAEHLDAERSKARAENARVLAQAELRGIEIGMDQCAAEIQGVPYSDPNSGLVIDPKAYQASW